MAVSVQRPSYFADVNVHRTRFDIGILGPTIPDEFVTADDPVCVSCKIQQDPEMQGRKTDVRLTRRTRTDATLISTSSTKR